MKITELTTTHVESLLSSLEADGMESGSLLYVYSVLRRSLNVAVRQKLVTHNVCHAVDPPRPNYRKPQPIGKDQIDTLLAVTAEHRLRALFVLAIYSGLRQGELFGLQKADIDIGTKPGSDCGVITVRHTLEELKGKLRLKEPKSAAGRRRVLIPEIAVSALWDHRAKMLAEGLTGSDWIFCDTYGNPLRKSNVERRVWKPLRDKAGLPDTIRFHDLRHSHASILLAENEHPKVVQERLGHSTIKLTLDTYSHLLPGMQ